MRTQWILTLAALLVGTPARAQGLPNIPGLGAPQAETPGQKRAFCGHVAMAAVRCGTLDVVGLTTCLVRTLPPRDSVRIARVAQAANGNAGAVLTECGVAGGR
ncbi:hypothetical protein [Salinarimonas soli]|uniref:UrcA family protein n=1 Tax=Salinarimonas soli TaxID=1638099 RepID=A0A5B2VB29_9HYPH|nr:hypothetical protein [Salinarimonas soli]KAA2235640.1 hypothetical protein F0L46_19300 [Salinarimonas soli]